MLCNEITENLSSFSLTNELATISRECSEFVAVAKQVGFPLYRGSKNVHLAKYKHEISYDRIPKDSSIAFQTAVDIGLRQLGCIALRANSVFTSSRKDVAENYGQLYYVFPKNGFNFTWSTKVSDMYDWHHQICQAAWRLYTNQMHSLSVMPDSVMLEKAQIRPDMMKKLMEHFGYTNQNLAEAMHSGHEILINGSCYFYQRGHPEVEQLVKGLLYAK